jgi:hypothetical protein
MAIAICGMGPRKLPKDRELWGMPWDPDWTEMDVLFEIHNIEDLEPSRIERVQDVWQPLYMQDNYVTQATRYPIESIIKLSQGYEPACSISFMLGFALYNKVMDIELHGVTGREEYEMQRPNIEYFIGLGRGMGADIKVCGDSALLTGERYGNWNGD